jgi:hypothetical protein
MTKLDLVGWTSMLPIDRGSALDLFVNFADHVTYPELRGAPYATIHHGADKKMASATGQQTKTLPVATWRSVVAQLKARGFVVVQLGEAHEELVPGVDHDFRGRTSLEHTAYVLKTASVHIDTEGGIVHLARSINTDSVVAFGPTPPAFFGYPDNVNMAPPVCGNCWWTTDTWSKDCPRGLPNPECMMAHSADALAAAAIDVATRSLRRFEYVSVAPVPLNVATPAEEAALLVTLVGACASVGSVGAIVIGPSRRFGALQGVQDVPGKVRFLVPSDQYRAAQLALAHRVAVSAYAPGNVPLNSRSLDWVVAIGFHTGVHSTVSTLTDLSRCIRPGGQLTFLVDTNERDRTADDLASALIDTNALRPGLRYVLQRSSATEKLDIREVARTFIFKIREVDDSSEWLSDESARGGNLEVV